MVFDGRYFEDNTLNACDLILRVASTFVRNFNLLFAYQNIAKDVFSPSCKERVSCTVWPKTIRPILDMAHR